MCPEIEIQKQITDKDQPDPGSVVSPDRASARRRNRAKETPEFVAFYAAYPRKEKRPNAFRAWIGQECQGKAELVMAGLLRWLPRFRAIEPDRVPHPASWLNGQQWQDDPPPVVIRSVPKFEPPAVRAEREREDRRLDERAAAAFGVSE